MESTDSALNPKVPLILTPQPEGGYTVTSPVLPELVTEGDTLEQAIGNVQDAQEAVIETYEDLKRPYWRGKGLKLGTPRAAVRQLGIDWETFETV
jgi:antitoxin HicB